MSAGKTDVALARIKHNVERILARFEDPLAVLQYEAGIEDEINDTIIELLNIREAARELDGGGGQH